MNLGGKMKEENGGLCLFLELQIPRKGRWAEENEKWVLCPQISHNETIPVRTVILMSIVFPDIFRSG